MTYSYDPVLDGGVTNAKGDQLCEQIDEPFRELTGIFRAAINEGSGLLWLLLVGEATSTSTHADPILSLDADGVYQRFPANAPVWRGARVELAGGVGTDVVNAYATDLAGELLVPAPFLQSNEAGTNSLPWSSDLSNTIWVKTGMTSVFDEVGITGEPNTASTTTDASATATGLALYSTTLADHALTDVAVLYVKKTVGDVSRCGFGIGFQNGTAITTHCTINTTTGLLTARDINDGSGSFESVDVGDFWKVLCQATNNLTGNTGYAIRFFPAVQATDSGVWDVTVQGSAVVGVIEWHKDTTIEAVEALPPIITISSARTISATNYTHAQANFDVNNSATAMTFSAEGVAVDLLKIGATSLLSYDGANVALNDGVTSTSYAVADGERDIGLALGSNDGGVTSFMQLTVDGVAYPEAPYTPIAAGTIATTSTHRDLRSDLEGTYTDAQAKIKEWFGTQNQMTFKGETVTHSPTHEQGIDMAELFDILTIDAVKVSAVLNIGTVYQEVITLTTADLPAGQYVFAYAYELDFNTQKNQPCIHQVTGAFASAEFSDSIGDNDIGEKNKFYAYPFTHTGGVITAGINMKKSAGFSAQLDLTYMDIVVQRVGI